MVAGLHGAGSHTVPGYLGINVRTVSEERVAALKLKDGRGAEIVQVDHDGPAGKMGLREHDVVLQMNGVAIEGEEQMRRMLRDMPPGRNVSLVIVRDGSGQMTVTAQMADRTKVEQQAWANHLRPGDAVGGGPQALAAGLPAGSVDDEVIDGGTVGPPVNGGKYSKGFLGTLLMSPSYTGVVLEKMGPQLASFFGSQNGRGLLVRSVEVNSPAAQAGMQAGDVVVKANAQMVASMGDWAKQIKEAKGHPVTVTVLRDKSERTLTLVPDGKKRSGLERKGTGYDMAGDGVVVAGLVGL